MSPYCFVITSSGQKPNVKDLQARCESRNFTGTVQMIDFDNIYKQLVAPAIRKAGMEPLIEHEEESFGVVHKTMYEKIILCEFCVADLTNANPNAYYELGMRYAVKKCTTIPIIASSHFPLPFDVGFDRTFTYKVDTDFNLADLETDIDRLADVLRKARKGRQTDSPLYDLVNGISFQNAVSHEKTDIFRESVVYNEKIKKELQYARRVTDNEGGGNHKQKKVEAIQKIVDENRPLESVETGVLIDMMLSYRNIEAFEEMMQFIQELPRYVFETVMVQEQYAFVLNRNGNKRKPLDEVLISEAESILKKLEKDGNASSETYGIWGRIYKDKFDRAYAQGSKGEAKVHLKNALKYYQTGFEADPRDAYPGVNYVTCLELLGEKAKALRLVPAVEYAVKAKMKRKEADYWDYATLLELAVMENRFDEAEEHLEEARPLAVETWMFETTKANITKIAAFRKERGEELNELELLMKMLA